MYSKLFESTIISHHLFHLGMIQRHRTLTGFDAFSLMSALCDRPCVLSLAGVSSLSLVKPVALIHLNPLSVEPVLLIYLDPLFVETVTLIHIDPFASSR